VRFFAEASVMPITAAISAYVSERVRSVSMAATMEHQG